jgi:hypothetical protein
MEPSNDKKGIPNAETSSTMGLGKGIPIKRSK